MGYDLQAGEFDVPAVSGDNAEALLGQPGPLLGL